VHQYGNFIEHATLVLIATPKPTKFTVRCFIAVFTSLRHVSTYETSSSGNAPKSFTSVGRLEPALPEDDVPYVETGRSEVKKATKTAHSAFSWF
jgi:hypothetical protein